MELLIWLIPLLPFIGFLLNVFVIRQERQAGLVASGMVAAAFVITLIAVGFLAGMPPEERRIVSTAWEWINTGSFRVPFAIMFDPLTAVMALLITGVGALIHVYSIGYMHGDPRVVRYFAYLNLFVTMMLFLVMANNLLLLFLGWEGVGLCSFLLIGFWFERKTSGEAAVKAFVVNRIGDAAFILAMLAIFTYFGTLNFYSDEGGGLGFLERVGDIAGLRIGPDWQPIFVSTAISFLLLIGATGKSAQFPLFVWLPDAMAGPTPVSALIHAATMVTGGVYLMARTEPLFVASFTTQGWVAWIGALTALIAGTAAMAQWDIKRVLAYSTVSQLGFMVAACGMGAYVAAIFHLLTHGIFKALLFLAAGSVIHGTHDTQDMRRMGGLKDAMPTTFRTYLIGALALAGIFPLAGFWSKDEILAHAVAHGHTPIFIILFITSLLTAFYMGRQVALIFFGKQRDPGYHPHESPQVMTVPLIVLAVGAVIGGAMNLPVLHWLTDWLEPVLHEEAGEFNLWLALIATLGAVGMGYLGWWIYTTNAAKIKIGGKDPAYRYSGDIWEGMEEAWYLDRLYQRTVVAGFERLADFLARVFDPQGVDGLVMGVGRFFGGLANAMRTFQTGYVRTYALVFTVGVLIVLGFMLWIAR
ncbi:MAG TPA: NADH-quinone oxidoreductase subunit L [Chloroflexus aurantiacus]|jgi:NADH-quinone oxidoreductase subunit L|uniref:Proton-translocating NADH-quinone oxidoreductase, chain L n=1 Tax=Chloroflexus aurantiacus (strain ATCC 29366 / DSM 635 / J-10-fl) TaxID=324602 RepID=A9WFC2_CHLAA|nr:MULTISPECIES: NADH-quinone oxidoreductase subunit L [Chloroflexus]ABY36106.1 proton-translocating NADH-quinone oxidoreductase, chain L [Chloroflexus aurantiacus J-10-fl]RMG51058.1 MAG: NADH-quinone oxidoreductase subunit L [Chloroflexota bacterium]GIV91354.1 MAG: NADH-quinone oxidoreductase subunit L [Chloroflexus sp.]HBW66366.1 NADH-quinone oxidoreductase subunit L [Chloroflexus aurantiacus]